jgi:hypothetical protein
MSSRSPGLQKALDRQAIRELLARYCRGIDRLDRALIESTYWPDAFDDHIFYRGDPAGFLDYVIPYLRPMRTQHFIGNVLIEFLTPSLATGETYAIAYHRVPSAFSAEELVAGVRYLDRFEKRGNAWRISERVVCIDFSRRTAVAESPLIEGMACRGARYPEDPLYTLHPGLSPH